MTKTLNPPSRTPTRIQRREKTQKREEKKNPKTDMVCFMICTSSTARRSRNSSKKQSKQSKKNPYSSRGLDKFGALLSELDEKKQKIYSETGDNQLPIIRFVYTSSNECVPLVIRAKERLLPDQEVKKKKSCIKTIKEKDTTITQNPKSDLEKPELEEEKKPEKKECTLNPVMNKMKKPSYYLPVTLILILVFLALFGRSFAIMCTCIGWYMVPTIKGWGSGGKMSKKKKVYSRKLSNENEGNKSIKKKDYVRKLSNESKGSGSPRGGDSPGTKEKSPCRTAHRKTR